MEDYGKFLEMVNEIKNIAVTQGGKLTKEEILSYLGDMQLSEEQLQALYQYLGAHAIEIENYEYKPDKDMLRAMTENEPEEQQEEVLSGEDKEDRSERNRRLYREELDAWNDYNDTVTEEEIVRFLQGERALRDRIIESRLHRVTEMTERVSQKRGTGGRIDRRGQSRIIRRNACDRGEYRTLSVGKWQSRSRCILGDVRVRGKVGNGALY